MVSKFPVDTIHSEHESIRHLVNSVGNSMGDLDAFFVLETERFEWSQSSLQALTEKLKHLGDVIDTLWTNLKNHFAYEEEHLVPVLGETIARALTMDHQEIARQIENVKVLVRETRFECLAQSELLVKKTTLLQVIGRLCRMIEEHAKDEDILIKMVKKAH